MGYIPRLTVPERGNPYYNRVPDGYNPCIPGNYPFNSKDPIGSPGLNVLPNCTGYATGRFNEIIGKENCNYLGRWYAFYMVTAAKAQGLQVGDTPKLGACMCWGGGDGHVAIVEKVISSTEVITSESGWNTRNLFWTQTRKKDSGRWGQGGKYSFRGFIYNPAVVFELCPYPVPTRALHKGDKGEDVKWMQWHLNWNGYNLAIDGSFGPASDKALRDFQLRHNLEVDGWCGPLTKAALVASLPWNRKD